ncbi:DedA family protein [Fundidesulfovibrio soli]|uniref:DedA family protein n=1 Tax=Fundidesulfovibrio soli TaxID=2922716 RepID=UPI001FAF9CBF|nr:DedA family protein [Fundidesulfovibrio soli]
MELISQFIWMLGHVDEALRMIIGSYGTWTYLVLFLVIFCETGLVVTPFLPGDSLLFTVGALCGAGYLDPVLTAGLMTAGAILGDNTNYWIGRVVGPAVFSREDSWLLNKKHLNKTHAFYEKHGGKTVVIARFMPIVRTFAPFVAGIGKMSYARFLTFSVSGGVFWICFFVGLGFFIGNMPWVKRYFSVVIYGIILLSIMPGVIEFMRARRAAAREAAQ